MAENWIANKRCREYKEIAKDQCRGQCSFGYPKPALGIGPCGVVFLLPDVSPLLLFQIFLHIGGHHRSAPR
jgi:hypothetical protein